MSCDKFVSSAWYKSDELRKPAYRGFLFLSHPRHGAQGTGQGSAGQGSAAQGRAGQGPIPSKRAQDKCLRFGVLVSQNVFRLSLGSKLRIGGLWLRI